MAMLSTSFRTATLASLAEMCLTYPFTFSPSLGDTRRVCQQGCARKTPCLMYPGGELFSILSWLFIFIIYIYYFFVPIRYIFRFSIWIESLGKFLICTKFAINIYDKYIQPTRTMKCQKTLFSFSAYGRLSVRSLLNMREHLLNELDFPDPYINIKRRENEHFLANLRGRNCSSRVNSIPQCSLVV